MERGYRALKFDPFGAGYFELERAERLRSIELVEAVRDTVGPDVEPFDASWIEEPARSTSPRPRPTSRSRNTSTDFVPAHPMQSGGFNLFRENWQKREQEHGLA